MNEPVPESLITPLVLRALEEDLAQGGDLTTIATIPPEARGRADLVARTGGRSAGVGIASLAFRIVDPSAEVTVHTPDGEEIAPGTVLATVSGPARALLTAERTALNLLSHLCGVATLTAQYVQQAEGTGARIAGTRKTLPGLRLLQKHAIRCGGGLTHRMSLSDAVMIKDNHIAAAGSIAGAIAAARGYAGHTVKTEVEVDSLEQLGDALAARPDIVLLDNMTTDMLREAVRMTAGRAVLEASGGVSLKTVRAIAKTGVDVISAGALTHSAPALDIGMDWRA